jgi:hypothetical protein
MEDPANRCSGIFLIWHKLEGEGKLFERRFPLESRNLYYCGGPLRDEVFFWLNAPVRLWRDRRFGRVPGEKPMPWTMARIENHPSQQKRAVANDPNLGAMNPES